MLKKALRQRTTSMPANRPALVNGSFWIKDIPGYIAKADANWPKIKAGLAG